MASAETGVEIFDYATLYGSLDYRHNIGGVTELNLEAGITNLNRSPANKAPGWMNYMDFSIRYLNETLEGIDGSRIGVHRADLLLGVRW